MKTWEAIEAIQDEILKKCDLIDCNWGDGRFILGIKSMGVKLKDIPIANYTGYKDVYNDYKNNILYPILYCVFYDEPISEAWNNHDYFTEEHLTNLKVIDDGWDNYMIPGNAEVWADLPIDKSVLMEYDKKFKNAVRNSELYVPTIEHIKLKEFCEEKFTDFLDTQDCYTWSEFWINIEECPIIQFCGEYIPSDCRITGNLDIQGDDLENFLEICTRLNIKVRLREIVEEIQELN